MDRRDAMKALGTLASSAGMTIVPVTTKDVAGAELVILKMRDRLSQDVAERISQSWKEAVTGTSLQDVKVLVLDGQIDIEIVRRNG